LYFFFNKYFRFVFRFINFVSKGKIVGLKTCIKTGPKVPKTGPKPAQKGL